MAQLYSDPPTGDPTRKKLAELQRQITALKTALGLENSSVGAGGLRFHSGGGITIVDGGDIAVEDGGSIFVRGGGGFTAEEGALIVARYPSGNAATYFGQVLDITGGDSQGYGLLVQGDNPQLDVFRAREHPTSGRQVLIGESTADDSGNVDWFSVWSDLTQIRAYSEMFIETFDGANMNLNCDGNAALLADGTAAIGGTTGTFVQPESGAVTANARVDPTTGRVTYVSSTRRVKDDIQDLQVDTDAVLQLQPRTWLPKPAKRQCPEWAHEQHTDEECHAGEPFELPADTPRQVGFVAEELVEIGLTEFVDYDDAGEPRSIHYDRLTAALIPVVQRQQAQIDALTARLDELEAQ